MAPSDTSEPTTVIALYATLAQAEAALHDVQARGVPYPNVRMQAHEPADLAEMPVGGQRVERAWSLVVTPDASLRSAAEEALRAHDPIAVGHLPTPFKQDETEQGAVAWRHYVFESPTATDQTGDAAGTSGTTGIINSGVFAEGANAEGNRPPGDR